MLVAGEDDPLLPHVDVLTLLGYIEPCPIRPRRLRPDGSHQALAALDDANVHIDHLTRRTAELDARIDRIVRSLPARIYRKVMWIPGVRRVLLWRRH